MDMTKLLKILNKSDYSYKCKVIELYLNDYIQELNDENIVLLNDGEYIEFLNGRYFELDDDINIENVISNFELNLPKFKKYKKEINLEINKNKQIYLKQLYNFAERMKKKYFHINKISFSFLKSLRKYDDSFLLSVKVNDKYLNDYRINIVHLYRNDTEKLQGVYILIENSIIRMLNQNILDNATSIMPKCKFEFNKNNGINLLSNEIIMLPTDLITNKLAYDSCMLKLKLLSQVDLDNKIFNNFMSKFNITLTNKITKDFDLDNGLINSNFDLSDYDNLKKIVNEINNKLNEYDSLLNEVYESNMHYFQLAKSIKIYKIEKKVINGDNYIIYANFFKERKKYIFFKNGIKVGRYKHRDVSRLLGYYRTIQINNNEVTDWDYFSKQPLSESQIIMYSNKLNWKYISKYRPLSNDMLLKFADKIDWPTVLSTRNIKDNMLEKLAPKIGWSVICRYSKRMSENFINNHLHELDIKELTKNPSYSYLKEIADILTR